MSNIFDKIGHALGAAVKWLGKEFTDFKQNGLKIAVAITEGVQTALKSGIVTAIADVLSSVFPQVKNLPQEIVAELQVLIPKILASELALEGLPDNPTPDDLLKFENAVLAAFNVNSDNSKLWTTLSSQIYARLQAFVGQPSVTFADLVEAVEGAYQDYLNDKANEATAE